MKTLYSLALASLIITGTGCKKDRSPTFMPACFREEVVSSTYHIPDLTEENAELIKYCIKYSKIWIPPLSKTVEFPESARCCNKNTLNDPQLAPYIRQSITSPAYWTSQAKRAEMTNNIRRHEIANCSYNLTEQTLTVYYQKNQSPTVNVQQLISTMGYSSQLLTTAQNKQVFQVPDLRSPLIAEAIKYVILYTNMAIPAPVTTENYANIQNLQNPTIKSYLQKNIETPFFWLTDTGKDRENYIDQTKRKGFISCDFNFENKTLSIRYESSKQRRMNFEYLIAQTGLAVDNHPATQK